jgi:hypothetical protein
LFNPDPTLILRRANVSPKAASGLSGSWCAGWEQDAKDLSCLIAMSDPTLIFRSAESRKRGESHPEDYDVFDGDRDVGRIYLIDGYDGSEVWFWGVSFQLRGRKSYGRAESLDEAKAAFRAEYERWQRETGKPT